MRATRDYRRPLTAVLILAALTWTALSIGCPNPIAPSSDLTSALPSSGSPAATPLTIAAVAGNWTLASSQTAASTASGCSTFDYSVTPSDGGRSAVVRITATCPSYTLNGGGPALLSGSTLAWTAGGSATRGTATCAFDFSRSTATPEGNGIRLTFSGTVCGLPASGSELLRRAS